MTDSHLPGPGVCGHWDGAGSRYCREINGVRLFIPGHRCPAHTPSALQGNPEPPVGPGWPAAAWSTPTPGAVAAVTDQRAIASGKRRSSPADYRAAQAAVTKDARR